MPDLNEFTFYKADCTQNPENCLYPHKVVVRTAAEANEVFKKDHVSARFKSNYRSNENFEYANCLNMDSDNKGVTDPEKWITPEDIHRMMPDVPMIISDSKNNMKPKKDEPAAPRNHVFIRIDPVTSDKEFAKLKERVYRHYPFFDKKALDAAHYFDSAENPNARVYAGNINLQEHLARLEAAEQQAKEQDSAEPDFDETIAEGSRNSTMFHFAVRTLKRYGNTAEARERYRNESEKCSPSLANKELNGIWKSALKYYGLIKQQPGYVPPEQYNAPKEIHWEPPIPFDEVELPPFPVESLPKRARPYVEAVAETTQTPVDMAGTAVLITMASCIQDKYRIRAKPDWEEPLCLYGIIVADPSERKSAVNSFAVRPLNLFEMEYNKLNAVSLEKNRMQKRILEKKQRTVEDKVAKGKAEEGELEAIVEELAAFKEKAPMQLYVDDVTPEKLVSVMADHDGVASIISAEGGIFDQLAGGMYSKTVNIDVFLKGHAGDTIRIDRIGRNSESIESPTLTMLLAVQPSVLSGLMQNGTFRGRGLTARFLYTMPKSYVGSRKYRTEPIPNEAERQYFDLINNLLDEDSNPDISNPEIITLSPEANAMLEDFSNEVEGKLLTAYADFSDWAGKLCGAVVRISGILCRAERNGCYEFLQESEPPVVDADTMKRAITLGKYYAEHARAAYQLMGADPVIRQCKYVLKAIKGAGIAEASRRDIMRMCRSFKKANDLNPVLERLCEYGYLAEKPDEPKGSKGRPTSAVYLVNPTVFTP